MNKNLTQLVKNFSPRDARSFWAIYDILAPDIFSQLMQKTDGHTALAQMLTTRVADAFLNYLLALPEESALTSQQLEEITNNLISQQWESYQHHNSMLDPTDFHAQLKLKLQSKLSDQVKHNPKYIEYYWHHFRFYFAGFCFATAGVLVAFLFWFLTFHKNEQLLTTPTFTVITWAGAFWELISPVPLFTYSEQEATQILKPLDPQYRVIPTKIPNIPTILPVGRRLSAPLPELLGSTKHFSLPGIQLRKLKDAVLEYLTFSDKEYRFRLWLDSTSLDIQRHTHLGSSSDISTPTQTQKTITKTIKNQITSWWLSLQNYGVFTFPQSEQKYEGIITLFIPQLFQGKTIYTIDGEPQGITILYDTDIWAILRLTGYSFASYEVSDYPTRFTQETLATAVAQLGIHTTKSSLPTTLINPTIVYQIQDNLLVPMLLLPKTQSKSFIPLV